MAGYFVVVDFVSPSAAEKSFEKRMDVKSFYLYRIT